MAKTYTGVQIEFFDLTKDDTCISAYQQAFLSPAYYFKAVAEYETKPDLELSAEKARGAWDDARGFVDVVWDSITALS